jgi:choline monooxygenase
VAKLSDFVTPADLDLLHRPTGQARGLPSACYGEAFYVLEQTDFFPRTWAYAALGAELPLPGDVLPVDVAGWPILLVRDGNGAIAAFHNICRHRGIRLVEAPKSGLGRIACRWHGWTYGLDGRLVATPNLGGVGRPDDATFDREDCALKPVRLGRWNDLCFVNLDGRAAPFEEHIAPLDRYLEPFGLDGLAHTHGWTQHYEANWKVVLEGGLEDYHVPWGHPGLVRGRAQKTSMVWLGGDCFIATESDTPPPDGTGHKHGDRLPLLAGKTPENMHCTLIVFTLPTAIIGVASNHLMAGCFTPDGPCRTRMAFHTYFPADIAADPACRGDLETIFAGWSRIAREDEEFVRDVQATVPLRNAAGIRPRFAPAWESGVAHFQQYVIDTMTRN